MRHVALAAALFLLPASALASTVVVSPGNLHGWVFSNTDNSGANASGGFVTGPATPPLGVGSAEFKVGDLNSSEILENFSYSGILPSDITALSYSTYRTSPSGVATLPALSIDINFGAAYGHRFVFEPYLTGASTPDQTWQNWNPFTASGGWYWSHAQTAGTACTPTVAGNCSWSQLLADYPGATVNKVLFKAGAGSSDWVDFDGNVDDFQIGTTKGSTTYNFEPAPVPEPASIAVLVVGLLSLGMIRLRRRA